MGRDRWVLYGATGYTGGLIARQAIARGHRPVVAGRSPAKVFALARALGLEAKVADASDPASCCSLVEEGALLLNTAGPFEQTAANLRAACLARGRHYLDTAAELGVMRDALATDTDARARGVVVLAGVGFDVVPTDCLARYVADRVPNATSLAIASAADGFPTIGTADSMLAMFEAGGAVRRDGRLRPAGAGTSGRLVGFARGPRYAIALPWADQASAYASTAIPNIDTFFAFIGDSARWLQRLAPMMTYVARSPRLRRILTRALGPLLRGPSEKTLARQRWQVWARAENARGEICSATLETPNGYAFTADAAVRSVEAVLAGRCSSGALTPSRAFGAQFAFDLAGVVLHDALE